MNAHAKIAAIQETADFINTLDPEDVDEDIELATTIVTFDLRANNPEATLRERYQAAIETQGWLILNGYADKDEFDTSAL